MSINLVTYANQTVTPTNDAIIYERAIDQNGIFHGCNVTVSGNNVNITGGYGMVCGREFVIESESIPVTLAPSGTNDGRLYVRLDLADLDAPIQLLTDQGNPLPPLEQDADVNYVNGAYEMELATFTVGVSALSDCVETFDTIVGLMGELDKQKGVLLFDDDNQPMSGQVVLSDSAANYKKLVIYYKTNDNFFDSTSVCYPNGKNVVLTASGSNSSDMYLKQKVVSISNNIIDTLLLNSRYYSCECKVNGSNNKTDTNVIAITQVVGYKEIV